jgi:hypothetical protein
MSRPLRIQFSRSSGVVTGRCPRWRKISGLAVFDGELDLPCDKSPDDQGKGVIDGIERGLSAVLIN